MRLSPLLALAVIAIVLLVASTFTIDETELAVVTQFGNPVGEPAREPGLHFKMPFVQDVRRFEKRILEWEGDENRIPTKEERFIWVDTTARWRIADPLAFLRSVNNERNARLRLDDILDAATRSAISSHNLIEAVRTSNRPFTDVVEINSDALEAVTVGREKLTDLVFARAQSQLQELGIELVDVRFRRIEYEGSTRAKVYDRMISDRTRIAERFRSEGRGKASEIQGQRDRELKQIESDAYRRAEVLRGEADAEAARIYAEVYGEDPEFYGFYQGLETLKKAFSGGDTTLVLSTRSELMKSLDAK
jgi:membrane protease subunit HflC